MSSLSRMRVALAIVIGAVTGSARAQVGAITDTSFFDGFGDVVVIDFETDGSGTPLNLIDAGTMLLPGAEYAAFGFLFDRDIAWVNDDNTSFDSAQSLAGIGPHSIPSASFGGFSILFSVEVRSVALWIANNHVVDADGPIFTAYDDMDQLITSVTFGSQDSSSIFVDGRVDVADYGVMGIFSQTPIARLEISKVAAILDDLTFSAAIPGPGPLALCAIGLCFGLARPRR